MNAPQAGASPWTKRTPRSHTAVLPTLLLATGMLLTSCASDSASLHVRVRNHAAHNLTVKPLTGRAAGREERVQPGAFAQSHASAVIVHAPGASIRLSVTPTLVANPTGSGYKYAHLTLSGIGRNDVIFEVMVDNENRTWIHTRDGDRVAFPQDG